MAVLNAVNGKAPAGAKVGDTIVTNGGSYQITGQKADGSWQSVKVAEAGQTPPASTSGTKSTASSAAPSGYKGSATSVVTSTMSQEQIKAQMNANSQAWYQTQDQAERDRLHAENERLASQLGGSVSYNSATGRWSGTADALAAPELPSLLTDTTPVKDNSAYLEEMAAAYLQAQKEALKQAYESNRSDLQAEQARLGAGYQTARTQTAADSALSRQRFQETAAAYGLNSGTVGQAQLAYANQLQQNLGSLQAAEQAANAEVERQRTLLAQQYQSALVQAQEENNYRLFEKLYNEAVRVDEALRQQSQFNAGLSLQLYRSQLDQYNADRSFQYTQTRDARSDQLSAAALAAQAGDYSLYGDYYGWDSSRVAQLNQLWAANAVSSASGRSSGGSGRSSASGTASGGQYDSPYEALYSKGVRTYEDAYAALLQQKYNSSQADKLAQNFMTLLAQWDEVPDSSALGAEAQRILEGFFRYGMTDTEKGRIIREAKEKGSITAAEAAYLRKVAGI